MTPALFAAGMVGLCAALCVCAVRAWRVLEARPLRPLEAFVARLAVAAVMAMPLLADAGALQGPRSPSVGVPSTGGIYTGQVVFSGVSTDITTGINENLTLSPNGTGQVDITTPIQNSASSALDIREAITNGGTSACNSITGTEGEVCIVPATGEGLTLTVGSGSPYMRIWAKSNGDAFFQMVPNGAGYAGIVNYYTSAAAAFAGAFGYYGSGFSDVDYADKMVWSANSKSQVIARKDNVSAGAPVASFVDDADNTGVTQFSVDGNGAAKFRVMTSTNGATCNSANEGLLYYRVIDASNKSGFCMCARTASGAYGWKMGMTFGSSALTDGDC